jgi:hypothetical protein
MHKLKKVALGRSDSSLNLLGIARVWYCFGLDMCILAAAVGHESAGHGLGRPRLRIDEVRS